MIKNRTDKKFEKPNFFYSTHQISDSIFKSDHIQSKQIL